MSELRISLDRSFYNLPIISSLGTQQVNPDSLNAKVTTIVSHIYDSLSEGLRGEIGFEIEGDSKALVLIVKSDHPAFAKELASILGAVAFTPTVGREIGLNPNLEINLTTIQETTAPVSEDLITGEEEAEMKATEEEEVKSFDIFQASELADQVSVIAESHSDSHPMDPEVQSPPLRSLKALQASEHTFLKGAAVLLDKLKHLTMCYPDHLFLQRFYRSAHQGVDIFSTFCQEIDQALREATLKQKYKAVERCYASSLFKAYKNKLISLSLMYKELRENRVIYERIKAVPKQAADPIIFIQRLPHHHILLSEVLKQKPDEVEVFDFHLVEEAIQEAHTKQQIKDIVSKTSKIFDQSSVDTIVPELLHAYAAFIDFVQALDSPEEFFPSLGTKEYERLRKGLVHYILEYKSIEKQHAYWLTHHCEIEQVDYFYDYIHKVNKKSRTDLLNDLSILQKYREGLLILGHHELDERDAKLLELDLQETLGLINIVYSHLQFDSEDNF